MKSIIELARETGFTYHEKICLWQASESQLKIFAALLKAEWLKEAGEMPEPFGYLCDWGNDSYGLTNQTFYYNDPGSAIEDDWITFPKIHKNLPLVTLDQCQQAVAAAVARKDAEIARLTTACNKFSEDEMLLIVTGRHALYRKEAP